MHKSLYDELKDVKEKVKIFSKKIEDLNDTYDTICYFDVLEHIEDHEKEIKNQDVKNIDFNQKIAVNNVDFEFSNGKKLFENVSLKIDKNSCVAFFGKSGQGKTTIVDIICKLIEPTRGNISVDNNEVNENNKKSFQDKIGYLSQSFYIINDTLKKNIIF